MMHAVAALCCAMLDIPARFHTQAALLAAEALSKWHQHVIEALIAGE